MIRAWSAVALAALISASSNDTLSADLCKAVALRDVAAVGSPDYILPRGAYDDAVTQYRVNRLTGMTTFCSHGGSCYPTQVYINGEKVEALRLVNCKVGAKVDEIENEIYYDVQVVRSKNSPGALRLEDLDNKFLEMGLCSACAGTAAWVYVNKPTSHCAKLAKSALEGNPVAAEELRGFPDYCKEGWK